MGKNPSCQGAEMLTILTYHSLDTSGSVISVTPRQFADQMACLSELGFRGMSIREAITYRNANGAWPEKGVAITFDDGYVNFYEEALPTLVRFGYTATVFLVSGHMGGSNDWAPPPAKLGKRSILSWEQAAVGMANGIEIGSHTQTHADLRRLSPEETEAEIVASRIEIKAHLDTPVESFAYPYGYVSPVALQIVQREFRAACTTVLSRADNNSPHRLPRIDMYYIRSSRNLQRLLQGQLDRHLTLRRWGRYVRHGLMSSLQQSKAVTPTKA
jgi:peptidoglycan/xylan/chitin deacetylase (PgdA/CDA1 family)